MTTLIINVRDDQKVNDVVSFLRDIDFLEVLVKDDTAGRQLRRSPAKELMGTRIIGDIVESVVPDTDWEALREPTALQRLRLNLPTCRIFIATRQIASLFRPLSSVIFTLSHSTNDLNNTM